MQSDSALLARSSLLSSTSECDESTPLMHSPTKTANAKTPFQDAFYLLAPPTLLCVVGVLGLMHYEGWDVLTSTYVIVQIVTTVGYGDFTVTTEQAKIFMAFYTVAVLVVLAYYYNIIVSNFAKRQSEFLRSYLRHLEIVLDDDVDNHEKAESRFGDINQFIAGVTMFLLFLALGILFYHEFEYCACDLDDDNCDSSTVKTCVDTGGHIKGWASCFYMSVITLSTVGFGDYQARTTLGRSFGIVWMFFGVGTTAYALGAFSVWLFERNKQQDFLSADILEDVDVEVLRAIGKDHAAFLTQGEFMSYVIVKYGLADANLLEDINALFKKLDDNNSHTVTLSTLRRRQNEIQRRTSDLKHFDVHDIRRAVTNFSLL